MSNSDLRGFEWFQVRLTAKTRWITGSRSGGRDQLRLRPSSGVSIGAHHGPSLRSSTSLPHPLSYLLTLSRSSGNIVSRSDQVSDSPTGLLAYAPVAPDMDISQSVGIPTLNHAQDQVLPTQDGNHAAPNNIDRALRACTNCVRAKTKCSPSLQGGGKCQRYHARRLVLYYVYVVTMV